MNICFMNGNHVSKISVESLKNSLRDFLDSYGEASYVGEEFSGIIGNRNRYGTLLEACNCDEYEFFSSVARQLESLNHLNTSPVTVQGIEIPKRVLLPILEVLIPGDELISVKTVEQYEHTANIRVPPGEREDMQTVLDTYPVRLSMHTVRQSRISGDVGFQFMPFAEELDPTGLKNTWVGQFHHGVLEQMYQNRPIFVLHMSCPVYCRFCFRKHKDCRNQAAPAVEDVKAALKHIEASPRIKEIVLTGGEPLMNKDTLTCAVEGLQQIDHIQTIRIVSRCISYYPHLFFKDDSFWLKYLKEKNRELQERNKRIEIATHFIHPDEISVYSLEIISELVKNGIGVYTQTPFLKGCNDSGKELTQLYRELRGAGSEIHYVYIPCSPIQGNKVYWTPLSQGHQAAAYMRAYLSDRAVPIICTATKVGKIDWNTSGWAVEPDPDDPSYIWIRTPYTDAYFKEFVPSFVLNDAKEHRDGTIYTRFMAEAGDPGLFLGNFDMQDKKPWDLNLADLLEIQQRIMEDQRVRQGIVDTGISSLYRIHMTRVEIDVDDIPAKEKIISYIASDRNITDVILAARGDILDSREQAEAYIRELSKVLHVNSIRLRSLKLAYEPHCWDDELISGFAEWNRLEAVNPLKLEIETQFVHSSEFIALHSEIIRKFSRAGITVYTNLLLLSGINDHEEEMKRICYYCRQIGIELSALFAAGMPVQQWWNTGKPIDASTVVTIATHLRRHQSGREVPLYVIRTPLGDADFNLTSTIQFSEPERVYVKLHSYRKDYFTAMEKGYAWPSYVTVEDDGLPVVPVEGLTVSTNRSFFLYT